MGTPAAVNDDEFRWAVDRNLDYLTQHLTIEEIHAYGDAGVASTAWLVPLHQAGCAPAAYRQFRGYDASTEAAMYLTQQGWTPQDLAAADLPATTTVGYLLEGVDDPEVMHRLHDRGVTPRGLHEAVAGGRLEAQPSFPTHDRLAVPGLTQPIAFRLAGWELTCLDRDALDTELAWIILGGQDGLSDAVLLHHAFRDGYDAEWGAVGRILAVEGDTETVRNAWIGALLSTSTGRCRRRPRRLPTCPGCVARAAVIRQRHGLSE